MWSLRLPFSIGILPQQTAPGISKLTRLKNPCICIDSPSRPPPALREPHNVRHKNMIITNCAACAAPLAHDAPRCVRCKTRYCNSPCQHDHWRRGHKQICKNIHRGGNAEQYHADNKYKEAVAAAVEVCAEDTKGQTCYICTEALHWRTKEGLVRMCACRGTAEFAHVSCLVEQAKVLREQAEENNLSVRPSWTRWHTCGMCEQQYHGVVRCALGWACWKTYLGRPETDSAAMNAMTQLANGLSIAKCHEDALAVRQAELSMLQRLGAPEEQMLAVQGNLASTYDELGHLERALRMRRDVYSGKLRLYGEESRDILMDAYNYSLSLLNFDLEHVEEAKVLLRKIIPVARRVLGEGDLITLTMKKVYAQTLHIADGATLDDLHEALKTLEETVRTARRVLGGEHPVTTIIVGELEDSRAALRAREKLGS